MGFEVTMKFEVRADYISHMTYSHPSKHKKSNTKAPYSTLLDNIGHTKDKDLFYSQTTRIIPHRFLGIRKPRSDSKQLA